MAVSPVNSGIVKVNDEQGDAYPWKPPNCDTTGDIKLEAVSNTGYVFDHWSSSQPNSINGKTANPTTTEIFTSMTITAHFVDDPLIDQPPQANAGADIEAIEGDAVTLDGTASSDALGRSLAFEWVQTSPATPQVQMSGADSAAPSFTAPGVTGGSTCFTFQLTVTDPEGQTDTDSINVWVSVANEPPVAVLSADALTVDPGEQVTIDGSTSYDPDGSVVAYQWDIPSGSASIKNALQDSVEGASGATLTFTAPDLDGYVVIALRVTDDDGRQSGADTMTLTINGSGGIENESPVADAGLDRSVEEGVLVRLDGSASFDPDGTIAVYLWELSDGVGVDITDADASQATFTAPQVDAAMALTFQLTVTDDKGAAAFDTVTLTVEDTPDGNHNGMADELESDEGDADGDGIDDFSDPDSVCFRHINGENEYISIYASNGTLKYIRNISDADAALPDAGRPDGTCLFGVLSYQITGLQPGETVTVTYVLPEAVPDNLGFYKISAGGWEKLDFSLRDNANEIAVTLTDGDPQTDEDGEANGIIEDPSALMVTDPISNGGDGAVDDIASSGGGCFIQVMKK